MKGKTVRRKSSETEDKTYRKRRESRELLIARMEELQLKHKSLRQDLQRLLDEKEDIVREKEEMNIKVLLVAGLIYKSKIIVLFRSTG